MKTLTALLLWALPPAILLGQASYEIPRCPTLMFDKAVVPAEYTLAKVSWGAIVNKCWKGDREYGSWFNFEATTPKVLVTLSYGGDYGTIKSPMLYLGETRQTGRSDILRDLACSSDARNGKQYLAYSGLKEGNRYWIFVTTENNPANVGSFTIAIKNSFDNDFMEAAVEVPHQNWCSEPGTYSTKEATPDGAKTSCNSSVVANRWFKLTAAHAYTAISVTTEGQQDAAIALYDEKKKELACEVGKASKEQPLTLEFDQMETGKTYFFSVDKTAVSNIHFPFAVCISDSKAEANSIMGRVRKDGATPLASSKVSLLDENMNFITSVVTDKEGVFQFEKLPVEPTYLTLLEEKDPDLIVEVYLKNNKGEIIVRGSRIGDGLYGFSNLPFLEEIKLLGLDDLRMKVKPDMVGITGKLVDEKTMLFGKPNVTVSLCDENKKQITTTQTDMSGRFWFSDIQRKDYTIQFIEQPGETYAEIAMVNDKNVPIQISTSTDMDSRGYFTFRKLPIETIELLALQVEDTRLVVPTDLSKLESGEAVVLNNLHFESASYILLSESYKELDALVLKLNSKPGISLEISGHTDNVGNEKQNLVLSQSRADAVLKYLVDKGVSKERLRAKGLGSSLPIADNSSEQGRMQNRRVEIKVVR